MGWVGRGGQSSLFQQGELRELMENAKGETAPLIGATLQEGGGEQRRANEVRVCRNVGTDTNSCETTMVSSRHSRTVKLWANKDTRLALPPRAVVPETATQHAPGLSPHL